MPVTQHPSIPHQHTRSGSAAEMADIASTAASLVSRLDELRAREPNGGLSGPNPTRVTLDQAAAAAADLHALVCSLTTRHR